MFVCFFFFKQKTAYEMHISDWSSDVCSSDLRARDRRGKPHTRRTAHRPAPAHRRRPGFAQRSRTPAKIPSGLGGRVLIGKIGGINTGKTGKTDGIQSTEIGRATCRESVCQYV